MQQKAIPNASVNRCGFKMLQMKAGERAHARALDLTCAPSRLNSGIQLRGSAQTKRLQRSCEAAKSKGCVL